MPSMPRMPGQVGPYWGTADRRDCTENHVPEPLGKEPTTCRLRTGWLIPGGEGLLERLAEDVKQVLGGVQVLVGEGGEVAQRIVGVGVGVVGGVGRGGLDDGLQLVGRVVGVLHDVLVLVGDRAEVAGAVVGVGDRGRVRIGGGGAIGK